jgi:NAD(P)-dependent dehydrogenase (short-subunit alcohol dehydrogenase family)
MLSPFQGQITPICAASVVLESGAGIEEHDPMKGKISLVTGATSGIGKVIATQLARRGSTLLMVARDPELGREVREAIVAATGNEDVHLLVGDLSVQADVRRVAREFGESHERLHVLVNNAGAIIGERRITADGIEMTFALNHLAYFLMTNLLLEVLERSAPARIVSTTSSAHMPGDMDLEDLSYERRYSSFGAYARSKLANIMFTYELARRLEGTGVTANCFHPGFVSTRFGESGTRAFALMNRLVDFVRISPERGADTGIYLATSDEVEGVSGRYFAKRRIRRSSRLSYDEDVQRRLWEASEKLTARG